MTQIMKACLPLLLFISILGNVSYPAQPAQAAERTEWLLSQHQLHTGDLKVYVTNDALRIVSLKNNYELIAKAPDWTVVCYRKDESIVWKVDHEKFNGLDVFSFASPGKKILPLRKLGESQLAGITAEFYQVGRGGVREITMACAKDMDVSPELVDIVCTYFNLPHTIKMPLELREVPKGHEAIPGKSVTWFDRQTWHESLSNPKMARPYYTVACQKIKYNKNDFVVPSGLSPVTRYQSIVFSSNQKDQIDDAIPDIGFTSAAGNKKAK